MGPYHPTLALSSHPSHIIPHIIPAQPYHPTLAISSHLSHIIPHIIPPQPHQYIFTRSNYGYLNSLMLIDMVMVDMVDMVDKL